MVKISLLLCFTLLCGTRGAAVEAALKLSPSSRLMTWLLQSRSSESSSTESGAQDVVIVFEGNTVFSAQQLHSETQQCLSATPPARGEDDAQRLDFCLHSVKRFLARQGYLRAVVGKPQRTQTADGGTKISVSVEEGAVYRLGDITIVGARLFTTEEITAMLKLKRGDIADSEALGEWMFDRLTKAYANKGHIQFTAEPEPYFRNLSAGAQQQQQQHGTVDLQLNIDEGRLFTIRRIMFSGNEHVADQVVRRTLLIQEGEPFNRDRYEESLQRLNELGLFEQVSEQDVEWKVDKEVPELQLTFKLKERQR